MKRMTGSPQLINDFLGQIFPFFLIVAIRIAYFEYNSLILLNKLYEFLSINWVVHYGQAMFFRLLFASWLKNHSFVKNITSIVRLILNKIDFSSYKQDKKKSLADFPILFIFSP